MKEKLRNMKENVKTILCIIGAVAVLCGAVFAVVKLRPGGKKKK